VHLFLFLIQLFYQLHGKKSSNEAGRDFVFMFAKKKDFKTFIYNIFNRRVRKKSNTLVY
jgi:hypothetical protein